MAKYTSAILTSIITGILSAANLISDVNVLSPEGTKPIDFSTVTKKFEGKELTQTNVNELRRLIAETYKRNSVSVSSVDLDYNKDTGLITAKAVLNEKVSFKRVKFDGKKQLITPTVRKIARAYTNKPVTFAQLEKMKNDMTAAMRKEGFVFSTAVLKPQKSQDGSLFVHLESGHIHSIQFKNTSGKSEEQLVKKYLHNFLNDDPLLYQDLEEELEILKRVSGFSFDVQLKASKKPGKLDIIVTKLSKPITARMTVSNHSLNKKFVSQEKIDFSTTIAAVNDNFHSTAINYTITGFNEMESINITHQKYLGVLGDHLVASFGFNHILSTNRRTPGKLGLDALYRNKGFNGQLSFHFTDLHSHLHTRTTYAGIFMNSTLTALQSQTGPTAKQDALDPAATYLAIGLHDSINGVESFSDFNVEAQLGLSLPIIRNKPVRNAEPEYLLFKGSYHHTSVFEDRSQLKFTFNAQYTHSSLLSSVLFSYGGMGIGKAYDGSTVNGDSGYSVGLEYSKPTRFLSSILTPYAFVDMGYRMMSEMSSTYRDHAASAGFGTKLSFGKLQTDFLVALAIDKDISSIAQKGGSGAEPRFWFSLTYAI